MTTIFYKLAREGRVVIRFDQIKEVRWYTVSGQPNPTPCHGADRVDPFIDDGWIYGWVHSANALTEEERCVWRHTSGARCNLREGHPGPHSVN